MISKQKYNQDYHDKQAAKQQLYDIIVQLKKEGASLDEIDRVKNEFLDSVGLGVGE